MADKDIDVVSNQERPLVRGAFSQDEWREQKTLFLILALSFALVSGYYQFILVVLLLFLFRLYSMPPLRLKRFPGVSYLIIGTAGLLAALAGFFLFSRSGQLFSFPAKYLFGLLAFYVLVAPIKDLKDAEGDRREGITTLANIFPWKTSRKIIAGLAFIAALILPPIFGLSALSMSTTVLFGGLVVYLAGFAEPYKETPVFAVYFAFILVFAIELGLLF